METRYKASRRPSVVKGADRRTEGVNYDPNGMAMEKESQELLYQDLKKLKNTPLYFPELDQTTNPTQDDTAQKLAQLFQATDETQPSESNPLVYQPVTEGVAPQVFLSVNDDLLETDCAPPTPKLLDETDLKMAPFPSLPVLEENKFLPGFEKILQIPELPPLQEDKDWLKNLKKAECQASDSVGFQRSLQPSDEVDYQSCMQPSDESGLNSVQPSNSYDLFQSAEGSFLSVQAKKAFSRKARTSAVSCVPREDLAQNFVQHELRRVDHFIPGTVQYTTKTALTEFVNSLPQLTDGTHGCICEEGYNPDGQEYMEGAHYVMERRLGSGSYGKVDLALDSVSNKRLVRKQIKKEHIQKGEIVIPLNLNSRHVTKVIGLIQRQTEEELKMELFLEYAGRSLNIYLLEEGNNLVADQIWKLTKQALMGLTHIHNFGMIHLDIKPENLCVMETANGLVLKITDFGSAKLSFDEITFNGWTPEYMAPESCQFFLQMMHNLSFGLKVEDITGKVDVFALSLVIGYMYGKKHVLLSLITQGRGTYHGLTHEEKKEHQTQLIVIMASTGADVDALINDNCDLDMRDLLKKMSYPREQRATAKEALDIVERKEMIQQRIERDRELKLQQQLQQLLRQQKQHEYQLPDLNKIGLPATVAPVLSREQSLVKNRLREKLLPYGKKVPRPETPITPVEEMQNLQIRVGGTKGKHMQETGLKMAVLATVNEEPEPVVTMATGTTHELDMTVEPAVEPPRPHPIITTPVNTTYVQQDSQYMPTPAVLGTLVTAPSTAPNQVVNMNFWDFIDIKNQKQENVELQGNIPNIVFDF